MSFRLLPFFLPSPAKRGVKKQKISAVNCSALLYKEVSVILLHFEIMFLLYSYFATFVASLFS